MRTANKMKKPIIVWHLNVLSWVGGTTDLTGRKDPYSHMYSDLIALPFPTLVSSLCLVYFFFPTYTEIAWESSFWCSVAVWEQIIYTVTQLLFKPEIPFSSHREIAFCVMAPIQVSRRRVKGRPSGSRMECRGARWKARDCPNFLACKKVIRFDSASPLVASQQKEKTFYLRKWVMSHETYIICTERKRRTAKVIVLLTMFHDNNTLESVDLG